MALTRRQFLLRSLSAGAGACLANVVGIDGLARMAEASAATPSAGPGPLVLCTLLGGNDGLNTVVPYESGIYQGWRPGLAISSEAAFPIGDDGTLALGLHPSLSTLYRLYQAGQVAVICGVEYPNPNFSHFESQDIWWTTDLSGDGATGWIGRWLDQGPADPFRSITIGPTNLPAFVGASQQATTLVDSTAAGSQMPGQSAQFTPAYTQMMTPSGLTNPLSQSLAAAATGLLGVGGQADDALAAETPPTPASGRQTGDIGNQLGLVAEMIEYGLPTNVYGVSWGSFDTHADQAGTHATLLSQLDASLEAFMSRFTAAEQGQSPVVLIYSEFGRTPRMNGSNGTDHSTASVVLAVGPSVKGGIYGVMPSFTDLDSYGNLKYTTDFRSVYATVIESVLQASPADILGGNWKSLRFV